MKNKGLVIFSIVICTILVIALSIFLILGIKNGFRFDFTFNFGSSESKNIVFEQEYDEYFLNYDIYGEAANIKILNSDNSKVKVVIYGEKDRNTVTTEDGTLKIISKNNKCKFFCFNVKVAKVEVYIPLSIYSTFGNIKIDSKYGDVYIEDFNNFKFNIDLNFGDISIDRCNSIKLKNNYGDIKIKEVNGDFDIEDNYGDVKIDKINIDKDSSIDDDFGDVRIKETNEIYIDAKTSFGDVDINNNYKKSDITLKIRNSFGDIKIDN